MFKSRNFCSQESYVIYLIDIINDRMTRSSIGGDKKKAEI